MGLISNGDWITLSVSTQSFNEKPSNFGSIRYTTQTISFKQFIDYIQNGRCFCHTFNTNHNNSEFGVKDKTIDNFKQTSFLWLDCDNAPIGIDEAFDKLKYKPNIAYSTFSNRIKGNRYRFIYLTDFLIKSNEEYQLYLNILLDSILFYLGKDFLNCIDKCCLNVSQQMMGSHKDCILLTNEESSFDNKLFSLLLENNKKFDVKGKAIECIHLPNLENIKKEKREKTILENQVLNTLVEKTSQIIKEGKFQPKLSNLDKVIYDNTSVYTDVEDQGIYEVRFGCKDKKLIKIKIGKRSKALYACGLTLKKVTPSISLEEMAASLWWIYRNACETSDDMKLTDICRITIGCFNKKNVETKKRKFVINPQYKCLNKKEKAKHLGLARRKKRNEKVLSNYDFNKTAKQNAEELGISENSIHAALKENDMALRQDKYRHFCEVYKTNPNASVRKLAELCGIANTTVQRYKARYDKELVA